MALSQAAQHRQRLAHWLLPGGTIHQVQAQRGYGVSRADDVCCDTLRCQHPGSGVLLLPVAHELCRHQTGACTAATAEWRHGAACAAADTMAAAAGLRVTHPAVGVPDGDSRDVCHRLQLPLPCEGLVVHCQLQGAGAGAGAAGASALGCCGVARAQQEVRVPVRV